jgi:hypothetical protein
MQWNFVALIVFKFCQSSLVFHSSATATDPIYQLVKTLGVTRSHLPCDGLNKTTPRQVLFSTALPATKRERERVACKEKLQSGWVKTEVAFHTTLKGRIGVCCWLLRTTFSCSFYPTVFGCSVYTYTRVYGWASEAQQIFTIYFFKFALHLWGLNSINA